VGDGEGGERSTSMAENDLFVCRRRHYSWQSRCTSSAILTSRQSFMSSISIRRSSIVVDRCSKFPRRWSTWLNQIPKELRRSFILSQSIRSEAGNMVSIPLQALLPQSIGAIVKDDHRAVYGHGPKPSQSTSETSKSSRSRRRRHKHHNSRWSTER
jgi:hypothetical protein